MIDEKRRVMKRANGTVLKSLALLLSVPLVLCSGCSDPAPKSPTATSQSSDETTNRILADVTNEWGRGNKDEAVGLLLDKDVAQVMRQSDRLCLSISESELQALPRERRSEVSTDAREFAGFAKGVARYCLDEAANAKEDGKSESQDDYLNVVSGLAEQLQADDRLTVLQQTGSALQSAVDDAKRD